MAKKEQQLPTCPSLKNIPDLPSLLDELAKLWFQSSLRPRVEQHVLSHLDKLIDDWAESDLPLLIRKSNNDRGHIYPHSEGGRQIIPTDNSPAHWSLRQAILGKTPSIDDIRNYIKQDAIPVAMILKKAEQKENIRRLTCTNNKLPRLAKLGWKVCHIEGVRLRAQGEITEAPLDELKNHFKRFLKPSNMFLIPKQIGGLGELPTLTASFKSSAPSNSN